MAGSAPVGEPILTRIVASRANVYSGSPLDRAAEKRADDAWIKAALASPETLFVPVWRTRNLVGGLAEGRPEAVYLSGDAAGVLRTGAVEEPWAFLGLLDGTPVFTRDIGQAEEPATVIPTKFGQFVDLRTVAAAALPPGDGAVLACARGLMHWRLRHRFCGVCGALCEPRAAGHMMVCTRCEAQHFPRTDPAVIMLVHRQDRVLLGHSRRFPRSDMYSTLAGFVEPGESLEEAVRREVREETAIEVGPVHYHSSQPWPFPANIMLGFTAEALTESITVDPAELEDARWFTHDELREHERLGFSLPRLDSIARRMIEDWMAAR
jgi:NAD+ diphosphatase